MFPDGHRRPQCKGHLTRRVVTHRLRVSTYVISFYRSRPFFFLSSASCHLSQSVPAASTKSSLEQQFVFLGRVLWNRDLQLNFYSLRWAGVGWCISVDTLIAWTLTICSLSLRLSTLNAAATGALWCSNLGALLKWWLISLIFEKMSVKYPSNHYLIHYQSLRKISKIAVKGISGNL